MTIHWEHPFAESGPDRDPLRRFRGRIGGAVSLWTTGRTSVPEARPSGDRAETHPAVGLTVSSLLVAGGEPAHVLGLLDPDSDLAEALPETGVAVVALLQWEHRDLADAFAGVAPAPGGAFRLGTWRDTEWGPVLDGVGAWAGVRLVDPGREVGWSTLVEAVVEHVEIGTADTPLVHRRGRYVRPSGL